MGKRVVIYQDGLLSYSETFIKKQAVALTHWEPVLLGDKLLRKGLPLEPLPAHLLVPKEAGLWRRLRYKLNRWRNRADPDGIATLSALNPQLIHAHFGTSAVDIWPYAKALGIPMLVTLHGFDISIYREWWESGKRGRRKRSYPRRLLALANEPGVHFLAVSKAIKERALRFGIPEDKLTISYIGVDADQFQPGSVPVQERAPRILYVGRLVEKKGSNYLVQAFAKVKDQLPDAELILVGRGPMEDGLKAQVAELGIEGITFAGALSNQEVKAQIDASQIFCLPSITAENGDAEGLPISILEAQASGVFVVTSSSGGQGDNLLDGETCYTFPEKDADRLAEILIDILKNPQDKLSVLERQKAYIHERFHLVDCARQLEAEYDRYGK